MSWTLATRAARLEPSTIREILKVTERPGIISMAGGIMHLLLAVELFIMVFKPGFP